MDVDEIELKLLLEAIYLRYGYDFRAHNPAVLRRRLAQAAERAGLAGLGALQPLVLRDREAFLALLDALTVQVSSLFRDPPFWAALRAQVVPYLRTYPALKLWVAGCAGGEEAHSLAILLHEEGLLGRSLIHATDVSPAALARARAGIYPAEQLKLHSEGYRQAGGTGSLTGHFTVAHGLAALDPALTGRLHFAEHDLATDEVFGEVHAVLCRNVLIYFDHGLQERALELFRRSLIAGGFLALGPAEGLVRSRQAPAFEETPPGSKIFRKTPR